jgi:hypothetical protein
MSGHKEVPKNILEAGNAERPEKGRKEIEVKNLHRETSVIGSESKTKRSLQSMQLRIITTIPATFWHFT